MDQKFRQRAYTMQLATQQLRLRNLTKIEGVNIQTNGEYSGNEFLYFSLHYTQDDAAFYISESLPKHILQKWADISCDEIIRSNKNCICVKVWQREIVPGYPQPKKCVIDNVMPRSDDKLLFCWGFYFSGLTMLNNDDDVQFENNTLIFHIRGRKFSSTAYMSVSDINEQAIKFNKRDIRTDNKRSTKSPDTFPLKTALLSYSNSTKNVFTKSIEINCDLNKIRQSYDLEELLRIQDCQRQRLRKLRDNADIAADIQQMCMQCVTPEQLKRRGRTTSSSYSTTKQQHQAMGRTLSILLAEEERKIEPAALLHAQKLKTELETLRFRKSLLVKEHKALKERITELKLKLSTITVERQAIKQILQTQISLSTKDAPLFIEQHQIHSKLLQRRRLIIKNLENRRSTLCAELQDIYPIRQNDNGLYTICNVPYPSIDASGSRITKAEQITPSALSASLSYIAHLVKMISIIIDQPLRCPVMLNETWIGCYKQNFERSPNS